MFTARNSLGFRAARAREINLRCIHLNTLLSERRGGQMWLEIKETADPHHPHALGSAMGATGTSSGLSRAARRVPSGVMR